MLRNYGMVVKLFCFSEWDGVFFNAVIGDGGVWEPCRSKGLLPCPGKEAVEACAESHIKDIQVHWTSDAKGVSPIRTGTGPVGNTAGPTGGCLKQMLQSVFDVNVLCLGVCSVAGVVCFVEAGELQGGAPVAACCNVVFHLNAGLFRIVLVCNAKLGIIV